MRYNIEMKDGSVRTMTMLPVSVEYKGVDYVIDRIQHGKITAHSDTDTLVITDVPAGLNHPECIFKFSDVQTEIAKWADASDVVSYNAT